MQLHSQAAQSKLQLSTIFDVAAHCEALQASSGRHGAALRRIFRITSAPSRCTVGPELAGKYSVAQDNEQTVVSVTNLVTQEQTWFNKARTTKPQTFLNSTAAASLDPTNNGASCDFCAWPTLTATDPGFGRIQLPHVITGSNLFKYAEPSHGIVLFRHHNPLAFSQAALSDLLDASWLWFQESHKQHPHAVHPFLLWNCLPRGGASQYHGHAQVMLSSVPVPKAVQLQQAAHNYQQQHPGCCYFTDLLAAHAAVGLARQFTLPASGPPPPPLAAAAAGVQQPDGSSSSSSNSHRQQQQQQQDHVAWGFASLAPFKDMEVTVLGAHMCCPAFQRMLHAALRALIDGLGAATFNVGLLNISLAVPPPAGVGLGRQHWRGSQAGTSSGGGGNGGGSGSEGVGGSSSSSSVWVPGEQFWAGRAPVVARLASRGKLGNAASDFGGLEVWGGASIGHTDPFLVVQQLELQLAAGVAATDGTGEGGAAVSADN